MASSASMPSCYNTLPSRTPKLTYRTNSDNTSLSTTTTASTQPVSPALTDPYLSPRYSRSDTYSQLEGRRPSSTGPPSPHQMDKHPKKKAPFLLGLFSVKEPSAQALLDYRKKMLKSEDQERMGRVSAVGLGVSSAKLPPTVPKVNSKWNGVPQTAKEKEKGKQLATRQSMSHLTSSMKTEHSEGSANSLRTSARPLSRGTMGGTSLHSPGSGNYLADLYGWEVTDHSSNRSSRDWAQEHRRPSTARSGMSKTGDTLQDASKFLAELPDPPKIPQTFLGQSPKQLHDSLNPPDHSHSPSLTPYNSSPVTPTSPSPMKSFASSKSDNGGLDHIKTTTIDTPAFEDDVVIKSAGVGILAPPAAAKRRPKTTGLQLNPGTPKTPDTLSSPGSTRAFSASETDPPLHSSLPLRSGLDKLRRTNSARDRLSLSMSLKHQASPPWERSEAHPAPQAITNGSGTVSPTPADGLRRKRLSIFKR